LLTKNTSVTRKALQSFCPDSSDEERLLRILSDFLEACEDDSLNANNAARYPLLKNFLGGELKTTWDILYETFRTSFRTNATLKIISATSPATSCPPTNGSSKNNTWTKSSSLFSWTATLPLAACCLFGHLNEFLLGSNNTAIMPNEITLKQGFYSLMPSTCQSKFDSSGSWRPNDFMPSWSIALQPFPPRP
jgi:hypothetical protein